MRVCVLSDIHYKYAPRLPDDDKNEQAILDFLRQAAGQYDLMVLNGDIFDLWFDWRFTVIKQYFPLLHRLATLAEQGCRIVMIGGNHDFWFGDFLPRYLPAEIYKEHYVLEADGHKYLFTHGDLHTVNDLRYKLFRRFIRIKPMRWLFSLLHPDLALTLGNAMSRSSRLRRISHVLETRKSSGLVRYAQTQIRKHRYAAVFMGHSHKPACRELEGGLYVNSGDWIRHRSYAEITNGNIELKEYTHKEQTDATSLSQTGPGGHDPGLEL